MTDHDFNRRILDEIAHRPWALPDRPWVMTQTWHDLLFAHWPVHAPALRDKVPAAFELDLFDGTCWLGIVPFRMTNVAPRGVPSMPWISEFPELNVRTYVRVGDKPGVYFFSLDAASAVAVRTARTLLNLPYYAADMKVVDRAGTTAVPGPVCRRRTSRSAIRDNRSAAVSTTSLPNATACTTRIARTGRTGWKFITRHGPCRRPTRSSRRTRWPMRLASVCRVRSPCFTFRGVRTWSPGRRCFCRPRRPGAPTSLPVLLR